MVGLSPRGREAENERRESRGEGKREGTRNADRKTQAPQSTAG